MIKPLVIIGTGLAGYMLAKEFRKYDTQTPIVFVTADDGAFYSKPMLSNALALKKTPQTLKLSDAATMAKQINATVHTFSEVTEIDSKTKAIRFSNRTSTDHELLYNHLVLACGAEKQLRPHDLFQNKEIRSVNNLLDYENFFQWLQGKKKLAIVGSGLIGCEFANDLIESDFSVDLISCDAHPLMRFLPPAAGNFYQEYLAKKGINFYLNATLAAIDQAQNSVIELTDNTQIVTDGIFAATGILPNIHLAKTAAIKTNKGIVVDNRLETNVAGIFALGDCAEVQGRVKQYVSPLLECARILAQILQGASVSLNYQPLPVSVKTPACPAVFLEPESSDGEWRIEQSTFSLRALYYHQEKLQGFALLGECTREKNHWLALIRGETK